MVHAGPAQPRTFQTLLCHLQSTIRLASAGQSSELSFQCLSRRAKSSLSLIGGLEDEALRNIFRYLSAAPVWRHWQSSVYFEDALTSVRLSDPVACVVRSQFTHIGIGTCPHPPARYRRTDDTVCILSRPDEWSILHLSKDIASQVQWIQAEGSSLSMLIFEQCPEQIVPCDIQDMCQDLRRGLQERCLLHLDIANLKSEPFVQALLRRLTGRLLKLVARASHVPFIADTCRGLHHLVLSEAPLNMRDMLCAVGPTLESLEIAHWFKRPRVGMELVQTFCPNLSCIAVHNIAFGAAPIAYAALLCSYRAQLRFACMANLFKALCQKVISACPN